MIFFLTNSVVTFQHLIQHDPGMLVYQSRFDWMREYLNRDYVSRQAILMSRQVPNLIIIWMQGSLMAQKLKKIEVQNKWHGLFKHTVWSQLNTGCAIKRIHLDWNVCVHSFFFISRNKMNSTVIRFHSIRSAYRALCVWRISIELTYCYCASFAQNQF